MKHSFLLGILAMLGLALLLAIVLNERADQKTRSVARIVRGGGLASEQDLWPSAVEDVFRQSINARKDRMLANAGLVKHPVFLSSEQIALAKRNTADTSWGKHWLSCKKKIADHIASQDDGWIEYMISETTPLPIAGLTCPNCVGKKSQEGGAGPLVEWDYRKPEVFRCKACGQTYPHRDFPETITLQAPRMCQVFEYYQNKRQQEHPNDHSGNFAYHWYKRPVNVSFTGVIRYLKIDFMIRSTKDLAYMYHVTGDVRYAHKAVKILQRLAHCYPKWLYHDHWGTIADCDPLYATWHDQALRLPWKRNLSANQYAKDTRSLASMREGYTGAGRMYCSVDGMDKLTDLAIAYDLIHNVQDADGKPIWTPEQRRIVERDLLLEWVLGAEPFLGGENKAERASNEAAKIYSGQAAVARVLGIAELADTAVRGYERVRDDQFLLDGFTKQTAVFTDMCLSNLIRVPEILDGFESIGGTVDLYKTDPRLRTMFRAVVNQLRPDCRYAPLSDSPVYSRPSVDILEVGLKRFPEYYRGRMPSLLAGRPPTTYGIFNLQAKNLHPNEPFGPHETFYPSWMTAFLRHGAGPQADMLSMVANPPGPHRHYDNLSLFYVSGNKTILGDLGYLQNSPLNDWITSTLSHNVVVVDDWPQKMSGRVPTLHMMFTTPAVSVVECSSTAYPVCSEYRRLVAMIKGPESETFLIDIFRVRGGGLHTFRVFSEIDGGFEFVGVDMPPVGQSGNAKPKVVHGLRDVQTAQKPLPGWQAIWRQKNGSYRLWMLSLSDIVSTSLGPGQETSSEVGRLVRLVDASNKGHNVASTFVAVHEPSGRSGSMPIAKAQLVPVPATAGPNALAVQLETSWGSYLLLSEFDNKTQLENGATKFQGKFGLLRIAPDGKRYLISSGARTFKHKLIGFSNQPAEWQGKVADHSDTSIATTTPAPEGFPAIPKGCQNYVLVNQAGQNTGYPLKSFSKRQIEVERFTLDNPKQFVLPALRVVAE